MRQKFAPNCWIKSILIVACLWAHGGGANRVLAQVGPGQFIRRARIVVNQGPVVGATMPGQASLDVDADFEEQLARADRYAKNNRYDLAVLVWQKMLDEAGDVLTTMPQWHSARYGDAEYRWYRPLREQIERTIAELPPRGLQAYREHVDVPARKLMDEATSDRRDEVLAIVARRYLLSSVGDNAAVELASRSLDRYDFSGALQLLNRVQRYPDSEIPQHVVAVRLAVASAHLGDHVLSGQAIAAADAEIRGSLPQRTFAMLRDELARLARESTSPLQANSGQPYPMLRSTSECRGVMPPVAMATGDQRFSDLWYDEFYLDPLLAAPAPVGQPNPQFPFRGRPPQRVRFPQLATFSAEQLVERWKKFQWQPSGRVLVHDGKVVFKAQFNRQNHLMCRDIATGKLVWLTPLAEYRWISQAPYQQHQLRLHFNQGMLSAAKLPQEAQFFADRINQSMTIVGDQLLTLDSDESGQKTVNQALPAGRLMSGYAVRSNRIMAYDLQSGKRKWTRKVADAAGKQTGCFLAAPIGTATGLVVPMLRDRAIWLVSLDPSDGAIGWSTRVCGEPSGGRSLWSPVGVSVEGGTAYVATGAGVVAAIDVRMGSVQWASVYQRGAAQNGQTVMAGCDEDVAIPHGPVLIVLASDTEHVFAVDRASGQMVWTEAAIASDSYQPVRYCLGIHGDRLYLAGDHFVRCFAAAAGRGLWERRLDASLGRGVLTEDSLFIPVGDEIQVFDLADEPSEPVAGGAALRRTIAIESASKEPIGNLVSDGRHLLMMGLTRVARLGVPSEVAESARQEQVP